MSRLHPSAVALALCAAMTLSAPAFAAESAAPALDVAVNLGNQSVPDPAFGLVSDGASLLMLGARAARSLGGIPGLSATLGLEHGTTSRWADDWDEALGHNSTVDARLSLTAVDVGLRYARPLGRHLTPYALISARGCVGALKITDDLSGWELPDPADPTGETTLYEGRPTRDLGLSGGLQGTVGLALGFGGRRSGAVSAQATPEGETAQAAPAEPSAGPRWGLFFEGGYALQTDLRFLDSGQLGMGGMRLMGGVFMGF